MPSHPGEPDIAVSQSKKSAGQRTFRSRILLLGILAGFLPLITIGFTVKLVSHSLQQEIAQSLADLGAREGQHLEKQQHALINSQIRQKALDVAEDLARFIKLHPKPSLA